MRRLQKILPVIFLEKIFYNGNLRNVIEPYDAIYTSAGYFEERGYVGELKTKHPGAFMADMQNGHLMPCYTLSKEGVEADFFLFNQSPFEKENKNELKLLKVFKKGEEVF